jgi:hypothetical protein
MAITSRFNGAAAAGAFYGYSPLVIKIADSGNSFTASSTAADGVITDGGYEKAVRVIQQFGSIVWLGGQSNGAITAIVDGPTFNQIPGPITTGAFGALKDAIVLATGATVGNVTITSSSTLAAAGTFTGL